MDGNTDLAEVNGWKHRFGQPQEEIHNTMINRTRDSETVKQSVIPISLDKRKNESDFGQMKVVLKMT